MEQYLGEIRMFSFSSPIPKGWAACNGQTLNVSEYPELAMLLGTTYGPQSSSFTLPDLRGRTMIHQNGAKHSMGQSGGSESVSLSKNVAPHTHTLYASSETGTGNTPADALLAAVADSSQTPTKFAYGKWDEKASMMPLETEALAFTGSLSAMHNNMQPSLAINYCICLWAASADSARKEEGE
jgi:microcystin-dependent protein